MTNGQASAGHLFCVSIPFPESEYILFRILAHDEVPHSWDSGLAQADLAAEFLDLARGFVH